MVPVKQQKLEKDLEGLSSNLYLGARFAKKIFSQKHILLIEDDLEFAQIMAELLEDYLDVKVDIAADTYETMNRLADTVYDCVVLDWFLQETNGKKAIEKVENLFLIDPSFHVGWNTKTVPVVVLSAQSADFIQPFYGEHFKFKTFISKRQGLQDILDQLKNAMEGSYIEEVCG